MHHIFHQKWIYFHMVNVSVRSKHFIINILEIINFLVILRFLMTFWAAGSLHECSGGLRKKFGGPHTTFGKLYMIWDTYLMCWPTFTSYITNMLKFINFCSFLSIGELYERPRAAGDTTYGSKIFRLVLYYFHTIWYNIGCIYMWRRSILKKNFDPPPEIVDFRGGVPP